MQFYPFNEIWLSGNGLALVNFISFFGDRYIQCLRFYLHLSDAFSIVIILFVANYIHIGVLRLSSI